MNVAEVIAELQRWPGHLPVLVLMSQIINITADGEDVIDLCESDACDATDVRYDGSYVVVIG